MKKQIQILDTIFKCGFIIHFSQIVSSARYQRINTVYISNTFLRITMMCSEKSKCYYAENVIILFYLNVIINCFINKILCFQCCIFAQHRIFEFGILEGIRIAEAKCVEAHKLPYHKKNRKIYTIVFFNSALLELL